MTQNERISLPLWKKLILYLISIIVFVIQLTLIILFFILVSGYGDFKAVGYINIIVEILALLYVLWIMHKPISTNYKLTWSILILSIPIPFMVLYTINNRSLAISQKKLTKILDNVPKMNYTDNISDLKLIDETAYNIVNVVQKESVFTPVYKNTRFKYFKNVYDKHLDMLEELKRAKKYIFMEYFIIAEGELMNEMIPILKIKGTEGVEIKILYDDIGSYGVMKKDLIEKLTNIPNLMLCNYEPIGVNFNVLVNYRDHRKITVIDGRIAYCGGDNLADEYIHKKERFGYWRDNCAKYEGKVVETFLLLFCEMWYLTTKEIIDIPNYISNYEVMDNSYIMAFGDGPSNINNPGYDLFLSLINSAKKYIFISTPYFIVDDTLLEMLALKAKSGISVILLMPHIPDKKSAFYMGRERYGDILRVGAKVYEFTPGFNHAKNIIVDDMYAFIGTMNMDYRSFFLHYECGAFICNSLEIYEMKNDFLDAVEESEEITYELWKKRKWYQKLIAFFLNIFSPLF